MTLELDASPEEVMRAVEALQDFMQAQQVPEKTIFGLALALEECGSNIVNHALKRDARLKFRVDIERRGNEIIIELRDHGPEFDPTADTERGPQADDDDLPGGWGIQLARRYTDAIQYRREAGENILRLRKRLAPAVGGTQFQQPETNKSKQIHKTDMPLQILTLKTSGERNPGAVTIKLTGSLDTATAPELERQLVSVLGEPIKDIVFDLAQLKFISSAGLRVFSTTRKTLKERGGQASFMNMQPQIEEVFAIMKSLPGVAIFKDEAELDRYLAARQRSHAENG